MESLVMTYDDAHDRAEGRDCDQTGRRVALDDGRWGTVINSYCCVADLYSGFVHLDGTPFDEIVTADWMSI